MSKGVIKQTKRSLNPLWKAKQEETLALSSKIIEGKAGLAQIEMNLTVNSTFSKPALRSVFAGDIGSIGFSVVNVLVNRFIDSFAFTTKLSNDQIESLTVDTLENFAYESLEDVILFFKMARSGKFGAAKKGVDSNLIFGEWYPQYLEKKAELREQNYNKTKNERNANTISMEDVAISYRKAMLRNLQKQQSVYIDHFTKNMDRQLLEDTIVTWEKDKDLQPYVHLLKLKRREIKR